MSGLREHLQELAKQAMMVNSIIAETEKRLDTIKKEAQDVYLKINDKLNSEIPFEREQNETED